MKKIGCGLLVFVFFIVCSIPLIFYAWHMYLGPLITGDGVVHTISSDGKWGDFAALWSAAFGAIGSIATAATLAFLIWQYFFKQQELFDRNIEVLNFQKYQIHKQSFNELIGSLESSCNNDIAFVDRDRVYKDIFPLNNFTETKYKIDLNARCVANDLTDLCLKYNQLLEKLKNQDKIENHGSRQAQDLIGEVNCLLFRLGIHVRREPQVGDFLIGDKIVFNSNSQYFFLGIIEITINALLAFSGNHPLPALSTYSNSSYLKSNLLAFAAEFDKSAHKIDPKFSYRKQ